MTDLLSLLEGAIGEEHSRLPKNGKSRKIDIFKDHKAVLSDHLHQEKVDALKRGSNELPELVFHDGDGKVFEQNFIRDLHKKILTKAGLREIKFHGLRHAHASILLSEGTPIFYVSKRLGHSSINITCDTYGKFQPNESNYYTNCFDFLQPSATNTQPSKIKKTQPFEIASNMV